MKIEDFLLENKDKISVVYYWYDHLLRASQPEMIKEISTSIKEHNWEIFNKYFSMKICPVTLPKSISLYIGDEDNFYAEIPLNEFTFQFITYNEYECGQYCKNYSLKMENLKLEGFNEL